MKEAAYILKKRMVAFFIVFALILCQLPASAKASDKYGSRPIYIGWPYADYMAEQTLKQIPTRGKTTVQKIKIVYDWIEKNCRRNGKPSKTYFNMNALKRQVFAFYMKSEVAYDRGDILLRREVPLKVDKSHSCYDLYDCNEGVKYFAQDMMLHRVGSCAHFSALLALLLDHLGLDCHIIDGEFINSNKSEVMHKWNYVLVGRKYYWLDVRMDNANYAANGRISHVYFMKTDNRSWAKQHDWSHILPDTLNKDIVKTIAAYSKRIVQVTNVTLSNQDLTLTVGHTAKLSANVSPSNASDKTIRWASTNSKVARVTGGKITAVAPGYCIISAAAWTGTLNDPRATLPNMPFTISAAAATGNCTIRAGGAQDFSGFDCKGYCSVTVKEPNNNTSSDDTSSTASSDT